MSNSIRYRRKSKQIKAGSLLIGGNAPVSIQSMLNVPTENTRACINQIKHLQNAGADLIRLALRNEDALPSLKEIISSSEIPLCADIHFNYRLAISAIDLGIAKIRLNPGNIGSRNKIKEIIKAAEERRVPVRIGVNAGSINRKIYSRPTPGALVDSALDHIKILEDCGYNEIAVSIKSSNPMDTIEANRIMSETRDYPIHAGLTEAGYGITSAIQSSVVIGSLLVNGIGDTIRVSMTGDPADEVFAAKKILETTGDRKPALRIISCPTCGRTSSEKDILDIVKTLEKLNDDELFSSAMKKGIYLTAAVMGCEVNGPGEAAEADCGLAGTADGRFLLFSEGEKIKITSKETAAEELIKELKKRIETR